MALEETLFNDMKVAMKSGDKETLETIRMLRAEIKNTTISKGQTLEEDDVIEVLSKAAKKRKESLEMYEKGGREDLAEKEMRELEIIQSYLPKALNTQELKQLIEKTITESGAEGMRDMGKVMGAVMPQVKGRADGKVVQDLVRQKLG